ncbi:MAG TPA: UDP-2,3-diacylglucosamine diphosphatase [Burkholderiales bacterium]|nr:UDP-2,3-diacylglucosamine diphosphatase [Burkholderiales bacterium]
MTRVRAIFLSDIHLGTRACQAEQLLEFLRHHESDYLFLVGDILDLWAMGRRGVHWSPAMNTLIQKVLKRARHGVKVIFVPGNHDEALRDYLDSAFGGIRLYGEYEHETADGRRFLILHGDQFDVVTRYHKWLAVLGDAGYAFLVRVNIALSSLRRRLGIPGYWSLAGYAKRKVKRALSFIYDFEESVARNVRARGLDGAICGHIHAATIKQMDDFVYINCGDWVDSCTAIVEHYDGRMELIEWTTARAVEAASKAVRVAHEPDAEPAVRAKAKRAEIA